MTHVTKVALAGAGGRMGRSLIDAVLADRELELGAAFDVAAGAHGNVKIIADAGAAASCDVLIDFTRPEGTLANLKHARAMVIGTTGFSPAQRETIAAAAKRIPVVMAANFAVGVNAAYKLAETAAKPRSHPPPAGPLLLGSGSASGSDLLREKPLGPGPGARRFG